MPEPFQISSDYVDDLASLHPGFGTMVGRGEHDYRWPDYGPDGWAASADLHRRYRDVFAGHLEHSDETQRRCARVMHRVMVDRLDELDHDDHLGAVRHMASPLHAMNRVFDLMSRNDDEAWDAIVARLETMDLALDSYRAGLNEGIGRGRIAARRQVDSLIGQARLLAGERSALLRSGDGVPPTHARRIEAAIDTARAAVADFVEYLADDYAPHAPETDGVGRERYTRWLRRLVGAAVDPEEAYEWGWHELRRLLGDLDNVGEQLLPDAPLAEVVTHLRNDPLRIANSIDEFLAFITDCQLKALGELTGSHFDVPDQITTLTINLAPRGSPLGAYYMAPSEDFTRPGGVYYSMGQATRFPLFHAVSTAYHEGFPGHHLQRGTAMANQDRVSRGQRLAVWYPGYGEGWALYAERLMGELGYLEDPAYEFGMLTKHSYRATRVVVGIGLHLDLPLPEHAPIHAGSRWTFERATEYLRRYGMRTPAQAKNETLRYLGWPGQAPAYKLGEREMLSIRSAQHRHRGSAFDLPAFHDRLIGDGPMPFDLLRNHMLERL